MTFPSTTLLSSTILLYSTPIAISISYSTPTNLLNRFHHSYTNSQPSLTLQSIQIAIQQPITLPFYSISTNLLHAFKPSFSTATQHTLFSYYRYSYLITLHPINSNSIPSLLIAPQFTFLKPTYPSILLFFTIQPLYSLYTRCFLINSISPNHQRLFKPSFPSHSTQPLLHHSTNRTPLPTQTTSPFFTGWMEESRNLPFPPIRTSTINHPINHLPMLPSLNGNQHPPPITINQLSHRLWNCLLISPPSSITPWIHPHLFHHNHAGQSDKSTIGKLWRRLSKPTHPITSTPTPSTCVG